MLRLAAGVDARPGLRPVLEFPVGVAGLVDDGRIVTGCNVENASYGVGLCAECGMVSDLARGREADSLRRGRLRGRRRAYH
jgi:cytidine deaminase